MTLEELRGHVVKREELTRIVVECPMGLRSEVMGVLHESGYWLRESGPKIDRSTMTTDGKTYRCVAEIVTAEGDR